MNVFKNNGLVIIASVALVIFAVAAEAASKENKEEKSKGYLAKKAGMLYSPENIRARTKPIGRIFVEGDDVPTAAPPPAVEVAVGERTGEQIYTTNCSACHSGAIPNAPAFGSDAWTELAKRGVDDLLASAIAGPVGMGPKGGCMDCTDEELARAITHMIDSAKQ